MQTPNGRALIRRTPTPPTRRTTSYGNIHRVLLVLAGIHAWPWDFGSITFYGAFPKLGVPFWGEGSAVSIRIPLLRQAKPAEMLTGTIP